MKTFKIKSQYFNINLIKKILESKNMKEGNKNIDFFYVDGKYQYTSYIRKILKKYQINTLSFINKQSKEKIVNKNLLYQTFHKKCEKYFVKQFYFNDETDKPDKYKTLFNGKIWIVKPVYDFGGNNIKLITDYNDFVEHVKKDDKWVISEYIHNPLLTKTKKKFHIRVFLLISITDKINGYIIKRMPIFTAKKKFTLKDLDLDIHNTHFKDSEKGLLMDSYFAKNYGKDNETKIYQQMIKLFSKIIQLKDLKCDTKNCFEIFGADIMITDDFRIKLLEINDRIELKLSHEKLNYYWFDIFYNLINNNKIEKAFHINNLIQQ